MRLRISASPLVLIVLAATIAAGADAPTADSLIKRHAEEQSPVWSDGDVATFFYRGDVERVDLFSPILGGNAIAPLARIPNSDVWTLTATQPDLERGVFSYYFIPTKSGKAPEQDPSNFGVWRGPKAPPAPAERSELKGEIKQIEIESDALAAKRPITVYLPSGHEREAKTRVIYLADGQSAESFAQMLEPLVNDRRIPPLVIVGVHCASAGIDGGPSDLTEANLESYDPQKDLRAQEYVPGFNPERFATHETFFCSEVPQWAEREFGVSTDRANRAVLGFSNGGHFAVEMGRLHPDLFGYVFGFSCGSRDNQAFKITGTPEAQPRYYLAAGTWETDFHKSASNLAKELNRQAIPVEFSSRVAGHDPQMWNEELVAAALWAFGRK